MAGRIAMGKKMIDENEFIFGKRGRNIKALVTASLFSIATIRQRK